MKLLEKLCALELKSSNIKVGDRVGIGAQSESCLNLNAKSKDCSTGVRTSARTKGDAARTMGPILRVGSHRALERRVPG